LRVALAVRNLWGLRLHLLATLHGLPIGWVLTGAKADEHDALGEILELTPAGVCTRVVQRLLVPLQATLAW
jgi:hypothetical protein